MSTIAEKTVTASSVAQQSTSIYQRIQKKRLIILIGLLFLVMAGLALDISSGPANISLPDLFKTLFDSSAASSTNDVIVWEFRLPFALMAVLVGASLGLGGAEMQTMLDNPLASPYTLGVSAAAAFGASLAITLNWKIPYIPDDMTITVSSFVMTILCVVVLERVTRLCGGSRLGIVLFGIALVFTFHALIMLLQYLASEEALQSIVFWTMGSLARSTWESVWILGIALLIVFTWSMKDAWKLTALRLGEERAISFGIDIQQLRIVSLLRISIVTALAVSFVGTIGFVGLVAPHLIRPFVGEDHRYYLPGSALAGALVLSLSSVVSKSILPGALIPIGIVTSLVGIPIFLVIIVKSLRKF